MSLLLERILRNPCLAQVHSYDKEATTSVKSAFLIHLAISLIIVLTALMRVVWFPRDLFYIDGVFRAEYLLLQLLQIEFYNGWSQYFKETRRVSEVVKVLSRYASGFPCATQATRPWL